MKQEQIDFLTNLRKEITTQNNVGTRDVMFVVQESNIDCGYATDYSDGEALVVDDNVYRTLDDFLANAEYYSYYDEEIDDDSSDFSMCHSLNDVKDKLREGDYDAFMCGIKEKHAFNLSCGSSAFFTSKACKDFIKRNEHNLSCPVCYGISSWNNPEMNQLREIIIETDWEKINEPQKSLNREVEEFNSMTPQDALNEILSWDFLEAFGSDSERLNDAIKRIALLVKEISE